MNPRVVQGQNGQNDKNKTDKKVIVLVFLSWFTQNTDGSRHRVHRAVSKSESIQLRKIQSYKLSPLMQYRFAGKMEIHQFSFMWGLLGF